MYWEYSPAWAAWWLMIQEGDGTARRGYGPFLNDWEIQTAAAVHDVPFTGQARKQGANHD